MANYYKISISEIGKITYLAEKFIYNFYITRKIILLDGITPKYFIFHLPLFYFPIQYYLSCCLFRKDKTYIVKNL